MKEKDDKDGRKTLLTILNQIISKEGILSLYNGLKMALFGTIFSYGIYFWWYRYLKNKLSSIVKRTEFNNYEITLVTALAGSMASIFANPMWMLNTRMSI